MCIEQGQCIRVNRAHKCKETQEHTFGGVGVGGVGTQHHIYSKVICSDAQICIH